MFYPELKEQRKAAGLTQFQLCALAGISPPTLIAAEQGKRISVETLLRLKIALGGKSLDPADLLATAGAGGGA